MIHFTILTEQETEEAKAAYEHGLILIYDASEADLESRVFEHDLYLRRLCKKKLREYYFQEQEDPDEDEEENFEFWLDSMCSIATPEKACRRPLHKPSNAFKANPSGLRNSFGWPGRCTTPTNYPPSIKKDTSSAYAYDPIQSDPSGSKNDLKKSHF